MPASAAGWDRPVRIAGPFAADLQAPIVVTSPPRTVLVATGTSDIDAPAGARAAIVLRVGGGRYRPPHFLSGLQQVLGAGFVAGRFVLLGGGSPSGQACCSQVVEVDARLRRRTILTGLAGPAVARTVAFPRGLLAAVATGQGVWAAWTAAGGTALPVLRRLDRRGEFPQTLAAAALPHGRVAVVWSASSATEIGGADVIELAAGGDRSGPSGAHVIVRAGSGHTIDELAIVGTPGPPTVAWVESWADGLGRVHSEVRAIPLGGRRSVQRLSPAAEAASGLTAATGGRGSEVISFRSCTVSGTCVARAAVRVPRAGRFDASARLGATDGSEPLPAAVTARDLAVVGWVDGGIVRAATVRGGRFGRAVRLSPTRLGADLTIAAGPGLGAIAVWSQATVSQQLIGAVLP